MLDGHDKKLLDWVTDTGLVALISDNLAVERSSSLGADPRMGDKGPSLPLHEHCLFKLGVHLGELWYLTELAAWLRANKRTRFLLTAPPLRPPGRRRLPRHPRGDGVIEIQKEKPSPPDGGEGAERSEAGEVSTHDARVRPMKVPHLTLPLSAPRAERENRQTS